MPALSTISRRQEWEPFVADVSRRQDAEASRIISVDWPGFGDSDRPRLPYDAELLASFLADFVHDHCPANCEVLVAPTWRGPFPMMARRQSRVFLLILGLVEAPLLGPLLYRLNTTRSVLGWMSRRHVDVAGSGLTPEETARRRGVARQPGARFASAAFVTGGLDPFTDSEGWIQAAQGLPSPLTVVVADQSPSKSLAEMRALALLGVRLVPGTCAEIPVDRKDLLALAVLTLPGGVVGPVGLVLGLGRLSVASSSLLFNLVRVFTLAIAVLLGREHLGWRGLVSAVLTIAGVVLLSRGSLSGANGAGLPADARLTLLKQLSAQLWRESAATGARKVASLACASGSRACSLAPECCAGAASLPHGGRTGCRSTVVPGEEHDEACLNCRPMRSCFVKLRSENNF